ncbi:MAG: GspH/FimT family pseudopilin [Brachymonas sp.]
MNTYTYRPQLAMRQRGLTMVELMVVLTVAAILVGLAIPSMSRMVAEWRLSNAVNAFSGSLRIARAEAIARGRVVRLCRTTADAPETCTSATSVNDYSSGWMVYVDANNNGSYGASGGDLILLKQEPLRGLSAITPNANNVSLAFLPTGLMRGNIGLGLNFDSVRFTSSSETPWARKALCVSRTGRVTPETDDDNC